MNKRVIIWDWNGTLLNDISISIDAMNEMLGRRGLELLDLCRYRQVFGFPVKDYYQKLGFDFSNEAFEVPAMEFIKGYSARLKEAVLFDDVKENLSLLKAQGIRHFILSAMEQEALDECVLNLGIHQYFEKIYGLGDHYAHGKSGIALEMMCNENFNRDECVLVGDTLHDLEIAHLLEIDCILISRGHQEKKRLREKHHHVKDDIKGLFEPNSFVDLA